MKGIRVQEIDAGFGLLIGSNVPEVLQPIEVREMVRMSFERSIGKTRQSPAYTANIIHTDTELNRQFEGFCNQEFNDSVYDSSTTMSQEDRRALKIMEETVRKNNGHYEIALPWKNYPPCLQNNKPVAEHRLKLLKKRLDRDPVALGKYKQFMNDLLQKGYATPVQNNDPGPLGILIGIYPITLSITHKSPTRLEWCSIARQGIVELL